MKFFFLARLYKCTEGVVALPQASALAPAYTAALSLGAVLLLAKCFSFTLKLVWVMGKGLSDELSCT